MKLSGTLAGKGLQIFNGEMRYHSGHAVTRLWVVVANQEKAYIYRKIIADGVELIATAQATEDIKPSRIPDSAHGSMRVVQQGAARHSLDFQDEKQKKQELKFVQRLAIWLDEAQKEDAFDRIALVAAPKTLGDLMPLLSEAVQARLLAQLDKNLAILPDSKIREHLAKIIWF